MVHSLSSFIFPICILLLGLTIATARELPQTEVDDVAELSLPEGVGAMSIKLPIDVKCENHSCVLSVTFMGIVFEANLTFDLAEQIFNLKFKVNGKTLLELKIDKKVDDCIDIPMPGLLHACLVFHDVRTELSDFNICVDLHLYRTFDYVVIYFPCIGNHVFMDGDAVATRIVSDANILEATSDK